MPLLLVVAAVVLCGPAGAAEPRVNQTAATAASDRPEDPRIEVSRKSAERLARSEEATKRAVDEFVAAVGKLHLKDVDSLDLTAETGLKACESLRVQLKDLAERAGANQKQLQALRDDLTRAPTAQRQLAEYYREQAGKVTSPTFRQHYVKLAENCEALIPLFAERLRDLDQHLANDKGLEPFLREGEQFFADAATFFRAYPGSVSLEDRRRFREQLKDLSEKVNGVLRALELFNQRLKGEAVSTALRAENEADRAAAAARDRSKAGSLAQVRELRDEVIGLAQRAGKEVPKMQQAVAVLNSQGRFQEAEKARNGWLSHWQAIDARYERPTVTAVSATRGVANHPRLVPEGFYLLGRANGEQGGVVRVVAKRQGNEFEVEAVEGRIEPGGFLLIKVG